MYKKLKKYIILFIIGILFIPTQYVQATNFKIVKGVLFTSSGCYECMKEEKEISNIQKILLKNNIKLEIENKVIEENNNKNLLLEFDNKYNIKSSNQGLVPILFIKDKTFLNQKEIDKYLIKYISTNIDKLNNQEINITSENDNDTIKKQINLLNSFTTITVFIAGLLDGINPCSIAMLLFFFSTLILIKKNKKTIFLIGMFYIIASFITYLLIGIGLFRLTYLFKGNKILLILLYTITIVISIYLSYIYIYDFINIKKQNEFKIKSQLSKKRKHKIQNLIRKYITKNYLLYLFSYIIGTIISILEFSCTGQVYLPTISYLISVDNINNIKAYLYLIIYNLAFIFPLFIINITLYMNKKIIDISSILVNNLDKIKLLGAIFFILIGFIMLYKIYLII